MPPYISSTCAHHQEVKIALHSFWYHHTYRIVCITKYGSENVKKTVEFRAVIFNTECENPTCYIKTSSHQFNIYELINITQYS